MKGYNNGMFNVSELQTARQQLTEAYQRDLEAIDHLIARFGQLSPLKSDMAEGRNAPHSPHDFALKEKPRTPERVRANSLRHWIMRAFQQDDEAAPTAPRMYEIAVELGATFDAGRDRAIGSIGVQLARMLAEGVIERTHKGSGRDPSRYIWKGAKDQKPAEAGS